MIEVTNIKLPTHFELDDKNNDSRFLKVKVYIAHTGLNLNNSIFSHDVLESMIPTLKYIPILGYIRNNDEESDFGGHEKQVVITDDGVEVSFKTQAYGFVGEDNNAHFEITGGKEWLVCDGYLWTRFDKAMDIFAKDSEKGQSMEVMNADGYVDNDGHIVFQKATFAGLCILGDDVPPAMKGATISTEFEKTNIKLLMEEMLKEFALEKGGTELADKKKNQNDGADVENTPQDEKETKTQDTTQAESGKSTEEHEGEEHSDETEASGADNEHDTEDSSAEMSKEDVDDNDDKENEDDEDDSEDKKKDEQSEFSINLEKLRMDLDCAIRKVLTQGFAYVSDWFNDYVVAKWYDQNEEEHNIRFEYTLDENEQVVLGEKTEVFPTYLTQEELDKVESERKEVKDLKARLAELESYQANVENGKKQAILDNVKHELSAEIIQEIQGQFSKLTVEDVEKEVAFALYKAHDFSKQDKSKGVPTQNFTEETKDLGYGTLNHLFQK